MAACAEALAALLSAACAGNAVMTVSEIEVLAANRAAIRGVVIFIGFDLDKYIKRLSVANLVSLQYSGRKLLSD
ncbi:hypothetical protein UNDKW_3080 [Undibacterium sp. KW1]|nr:hypothetical protein UNDKW_3080 [Undibacterium sp. KW1]